MCSGCARRQDSPTACRSRAPARTASYAIWRSDSALPAPRPAVKVLSAGSATWLCDFVAHGANFLRPSGPPSYAALAASRRLESPSAALRPGSRMTDTKEMLDAVRTPAPLPTADAAAAIDACLQCVRRVLPAQRRSRGRGVRRTPHVRRVVPELCGRMRRHGPSSFWPAHSDQLVTQRLLQACVRASEQRGHALATPTITVIARSARGSAGSAPRRAARCSRLRRSTSRKDRPGGCVTTCVTMFGCRTATQTSGPLDLNRTSAFSSSETTAILEYGGLRWLTDPALSPPVSTEVSRS